MGDVQGGGHQVPHPRTLAGDPDQDAVGRPAGRAGPRPLPGVAEQLAAIGRWQANPAYHWYAVGQTRRLAAAPVGDGRVTEALDRFSAGDDPYLRLAAAQADLAHRRELARERLARLAGSGSGAGPDRTVVLPPRRRSGPVRTPPCLRR